MRRSLVTGALCAAALAVACRRPAAPPSLTVSVPFQVDTLDPHLHDRLGYATVAAHFYEPLVALDAEMGIRPALAERWSTPDPLTWVFRLRAGARFHDGHELTAEDVVHTFERLRRDPALSLGIYAVQVESVRALSAREVEVRTSRPAAVLLNKLAGIPIVGRAEPSDLTLRPNGTGPYRLVRFEKDRVVMERRGDRDVPEPQVAGVTFLLGRGAEEAAEDVLSGRSQLAVCSSREAVRKLGGCPGVTNLRRAELFVKYLAFDVRAHPTPFVAGPRNPFASPEVRQAVSLLVDRRALAAGLPAFAVPAHQLVPATIFGHDPALPDLPHDPSRALALLQKAGFGSGFSVTLHTRRHLAETARRVAEQLAPAGIRVEVAELPEAAFFELASRGGLSLFLTGLGCASGDASDFLDAALHTVDERRRLGRANYGRFSDPSLDAEIESSGELLVQVERRDALQRILRRARETYAWLPLTRDEVVYAVAAPFTFRPRANSTILASEVSLAAP